MRTRNLVRATVAGLFALLTVGFVIRENGIAAALAGGDAATALTINSGSSSARSMAAAAAVERGDFAAGEADARRALASAPMDAQALRSLALARYHQGDTAGASAALRLAGALGWRDTPTQLLILSDAMDRRDVATGVQRADALARRARELPTVFALFRSIGRMPGGVDALVERLAQSPRWRPQFLADNGSLTPEDYAVREAVYAGLAKTAAPPEPEEVAPYVASLIAGGEYRRARAVWVRWVGQGGNPAAALQDGGFAHLSGDEGGFGWRVHNLVGAEVSRQDDIDNGRDGLRVEVEGGASGILLSQLVTLPPGQHRFAVQAIFPDVAARDALRWVVRCVAGDRDIGLDLKPAGEVGPWTRLQGTVEVPAAGCPAQTVELRTRGSDSAARFTASFARADLD